MLLTTAKSWGILAAIIGAIGVTGTSFKLGTTYGQNKQKVAFEEDQSAREQRIATLQRELTQLKERYDGKVKDQVAALDEAYQRGLQETQAWYTTADLIHHANEHGGLSIDVKSTCSDTKDTDSQPTDTARLDNGTQRAELSGQAAQFLIDEARRADAVVKQLQACQSLVEIYYDTIEQAKLDIKSKD